MKYCLNCSRTYEGASWECPSCGHAPENRNGFPVFAPELETSDDFYDPGVFEHLAEDEDGSFWFKNRNALISWVFGEYFPGARSLFEIGCGTGVVTHRLADVNPGLDITGADVFVEGLAQASRRLEGRARFIQASIFNIPYRDAFDVVAAFDVVEHIEDDVAAVRELFLAAKPGGGVLITVPRHMFLWSRVDELSQHKRRDAARQLAETCEKAGLEVVRLLSFGAMTIIPQFIARRFLVGGKPWPTSWNRAFPHRSNSFSACS